MTAGDEDDCLMNGFSGSLAQRLAQSLSPAIVGMGATGARSAARMPPRGRTWGRGPCGAHPQPHDEAPGAVQRRRGGLAWQTSTGAWFSTKGRVSWEFCTTKRHASISTKHHASWPIPSTKHHAYVQVVKSK